MKVVQVSNPDLLEKELPHLLTAVFAERLQEDMAKFCVESGLSSDTIRALLSKWKSKLDATESIAPRCRVTDGPLMGPNTVPSYSHPLLSEVVRPLGPVQNCSGRPQDICFPTSGPVYPVDAHKYDLRGNPLSNIMVRYIGTKSTRANDSSLDQSEGDGRSSKSNSNSNSYNSSSGSSSSSHYQIVHPSENEGAGCEPAQGTADMNPDVDPDEQYYAEYARRGYDSFIIGQCGSVRTILYYNILYFVSILSFTDLTCCYSIMCCCVV